VSEASDVAALKALITALQQRCTRLENDVKTIREQLARVKKG
jgi:hypothetical protein